MTAKSLFEQGLEKMKSFDLRGVMPALRAANEGALNDVQNINGCAYYQFTPGLIDLIKPQQIVELGSAMGVWTIMAMYNLPKESVMYGITLPEHGLEFSYVVDPYPNLTRIVGDDLDTDVWPDGTDLFGTDLWFFDSVHDPDHLRQEIDLYKMFFKKGAVLLFDDIHSFGLEPVWNELKYDKVDCTDPLHFSGFGLAKV